jgi:hypothetical protein
MTMQPRKPAAAGAPRQKLHSIAGILNNRTFDGRISAGRASYTFTYAPASAAIVDGRFQLTGRLTVKRPTGIARSAENVTATLIGIQGGIDNPPGVRGHMPVTIGDPQTQQQQTAGLAGVATPTDEQVRLSAPEGPQAPGTLPPTQATGERSFLGVLYLKLVSLEGKGLGLPYDLSDVQFNARLFPQNDGDRALVWELTDVVQALHGERPNPARAAEEVQHINRILGGETPATLPQVRRQVFDELAD